MQNNNFTIIQKVEPSHYISQLCNADCFKVREQGPGGKIQHLCLIPTDHHILASLETKSELIAQLVRSGKTLAEELFFSEKEDERGRLKQYLNIIEPCDCVSLHRVFNTQQHLSACLLDGRKDEDIIKEFMFDLLLFLDTLHARNETFKYLNSKNLFIDGNGELRFPFPCLWESFRRGKKQKNPEDEEMMPEDDWYLSPELLLCEEEDAEGFLKESDMWAAGCIFGQMFSGIPLFSGADVSDQVIKMIEVVGLPKQDERLSFLSSKHYSSLHRGTSQPPLIVDMFPTLEDDGLELLMQLLQMNPFNRITSREALSHKYFKDYAEHVPEQQDPINEAEESLEGSLSSIHDSDEQVSLESQEHPMDDDEISNLISSLEMEPSEEPPIPKVDTTTQTIVQNLQPPSTVTRSQKMMHHSFDDTDAEDPLEFLKRTEHIKREVVMVPEYELPSLEETLDIIPLLNPAVARREARPNTSQATVTRPDLPQPTVIPNPVPQQRTRPKQRTGLRLQSIKARILKEATKKPTPIVVKSSGSSSESSKRSAQKPIMKAPKAPSVQLSDVTKGDSSGYSSSSSRTESRKRKEVLTLSSLGQVQPTRETKQDMKSQSNTDSSRRSSADLQQPLNTSTGHSKVENVITYLKTLTQKLDGQPAETAPSVPEKPISNFQPPTRGAPTRQEVPETAPTNLNSSLMKLISEFDQRLQATKNILQQGEVSSSSSPISTKYTTPSYRSHYIPDRTIRETSPIRDMDAPQPSYQGRSQPSLFEERFENIDMEHNGVLFVIERLSLSLSLPHGLQVHFLYKFGDEVVETTPQSITGTSLKVNHHATYRVLNESLLDTCGDISNPLIVQLWSLDGLTSQRRLLGVATIDLSPLVTLPTIDGWYHVFSQERGGPSHTVGQLKIQVKPSLPLVKYRKYRSYRQ